MRITKLLIYALLPSLFFAAPALAHKVNIFAYVDGGKIFTESYFPDGRPVNQGAIEIRDSSDELLLEGRSDAAGLYNCSIPKVDDLTIVIKASMGHKNSYLLKKTEVEAGQ